MKNHGTALSEGQLAEFLGAGTKALTLIANQLGPDLTDNWARNSGAMQKAFLSALCPLAAPAPLTPHEFAVWKTLKRPADASAEKYRASYKKKGISIGNWADDILGKVDFAEGSGEVDVARVTVKELEFNRATRRDTIYERAFSLGLMALPHWAALELRDNYDDQPNGEWLIAGMEPITGSGGSPKLFYVGRYDDGGRWLGSGWGFAGYEWNPENVFLFAVPRK